MNDLCDKGIGATIHRPSEIAISVASDIGTIRCNREPTNLFRAVAAEDDVIDKCPVTIENRDEEIDEKRAAIEFGDIAADPSATSGIDPNAHAVFRSGGSVE